MTRPLSPVAQAVYDDVESAHSALLDESPISAEALSLVAAVALRAAADAVVPDEKPTNFVPGAPQAFAMQRRTTRRALLAIANELDPS